MEKYLHLTSLMSNDLTSFQNRLYFPLFSRCDHDCMLSFFGIKSTLKPFVGGGRVNVGFVHRWSLLILLTSVCCSYRKLPYRNKEELFKRGWGMLSL